MDKLVVCSKFVKRQTPESGYSHYDGSWEELEDLVGSIFICDKSKVRQGYRDGVVLVDLIDLTDHFYSSIVELDENSKLSVNYAARQDGEAPSIRVAVKAKKQQAKYVSVVLYRSDVLAEDNDRSSDAEWEIIAIKARVSEEEDLMDPMTMARNFLHLEGGTKGDFTAEQFAKSIVFWGSHAMTAGKPKWYRKVIKLIQEIQDIILATMFHSYKSLPYKKKF